MRLRDPWPAQAIRPKTPVQSPCFGTRTTLKPILTPAMLPTVIQKAFFGVDECRAAAAGVPSAPVFADAVSDGAIDIRWQSSAGRQRIEATISDVVGCELRTGRAVCALTTSNRADEAQHQTPVAGTAITWT